MPPFLPTKRLRDEAKEDASAPPPKRGRVAASSKPAPSKKAPAKPRQTLAEALDGTGTTGTIADRRKLLENDVAEEERSESSEEDSDEFEDVPGTANAPAHDGHAHKHRHARPQDAESDESEGMEFEDVAQPHHHHGKHKHHHHHIEDEVETPIGDISIDLPAPGATPISDGNLAFSDARGVVGKKGPSKIERLIRQNTHCMHVQFLMFHNTIRNAWCQDKQVQDMLVKQLPQALQKEVARWNKALGGSKATALNKKPAPAKLTKGKNRAKGKAKPKTRHEDDDEALKELIPTRHEYDDRALRDRMRDWGAEAEPLEDDEPDLSHGDPTIRLLRYLAAYWRKRFLITAPSLHKHGYLAPKDLETEVKAWEKQPDDVERFGERVKSKAEFRQAAKKYEGSRDTGAQLFTALLRGVGLHARMVVSLQPVGFGFGKVEDGEPYKKKPVQVKKKEKDHAAFTPSALKRGIDMKKKVRQLEQTPKTDDAPTRKTKRGSSNTAPISLDTSSSDELSEAPSDISDDPSIVDVTPSRKPTKAYEAPPLPTYWTEALSPITHSFIPVVCLPQPLIANSPELLASFTPSGKAAEKAKQVLAYVVAYSADGSAKDVTVRYLKKKQWPGKTRGVRVPREKVPIYNKRGKVRKWIEWDWFHEVMSGYMKDPRLRSRAEKMEDEVDLVPIEPTKKDEEAGTSKGNVGGKPESLQAYKNSADYVLGRHLRREEAIIPGAEPVRHFATGKGDNVKSEPVYRRADVLTGMTVESWHKQGRAVKQGEQPIKMVPIRAVTLIRKREVEDAARETGEKPMQGLYSEDQTDWIVPDPIGPDRRIPKNAFGNIDIYVPSMVPAGAVHVRLKGTAKLCRKLEIDYSEAVTGFEFGKQRAVPVITGVVVAEEHEGAVKDAWRAEQLRVKERERIKRQAACVAMWKKFLGGLRVLERMRDDYGHVENAEADEVNPWMNKKAREQLQKANKAARKGDRPGLGNATAHAEDVDMLDADFADDDDGGGGFIPEGMIVEEPRPRKQAQETIDAEEESGGFLLEDDTEGQHSEAANDAVDLDIAANGQDEPSSEPEQEPDPKSTQKKRGRSAKSTSVKAAGLSKRVADARRFAADNDPTTETDPDAHPQSDMSQRSVPEPSSEEDATPQKKRRVSGSAGKVAGPKKNNGTRATPRRRATNGVRSRYFESDDRVTE